MSSLESILSGERETAPAPEANTPIAQPETNAEAAAPEPSSNDEPQPDETGKVPLAALHAEREKGKRRYTEVVSDVEKRIDEVNRNWEARFAQIMTAVVPKQQPAAEAPKPEIWDNPDEYIASRVSEIVAPHRQHNLALARELAEVRYQPETVKAAEEAFNRAAAMGQIDPDIHRKINSSPNPFAAAVQWHQQASAMAEMGSDPAAYKAKLRDELKAEIMAELNPQGQAPAGNQPAPVMPSNFAAARNVGTRAGPTWSGPPPLEDIFRRK